MTVAEILAEAERRGLTLRADGERLAYEGPAGAMTPELRQEITALKPELLRRLRPDASNEEGRGTDAHVPGRPSDAPAAASDVPTAAPTNSPGEGAAHCDPRAEYRAAYARLRAHATDCPSGPFDIVERVWPAVAAEIESAREAANHAAVLVMRNDHAAVETFRRQLKRWEAAWRDGLERLANGCHVCGSTTATTHVVDDLGVRHCSACWPSGRTR